MGILDKVFGKKEAKEKQAKIDWIPLTSIEQLNSIIEKSEKTALLFKHSTRCGISASVLRKFETKNEGLREQLDFYYLDLLNHRDISAAMAEKFNVVHQSPQAIVVKNGTAVANESHYDIIGIDLENYS
ncbi:bacillithiol system redox-active protein YtxJ [Flavicella sediminum]|uniref:bacillithiol system redox-active protein YtxJ n=1 Tax=Flavicella sediminum TaxID=2585141 RepID=UPI00111D9E48|nr:bacillithiol system redox-active protein YtxJ [Flavicella sediminum]